MKQIILPVTVHLNIRLPLALLEPEPADAPTGPGARRPMPARAAATVADAGNASMKKSKPETRPPSWNYRQYRRRGRLVHECCNYDGGNCIALDDGEECVCVQSIFLLPAVPVVPGGGAAAGQRAGNSPVPPPGRQTVRLSVVRCSPPAPTGPNTARNVPGRMKRIKAAQRKRKQRGLKCPRFSGPKTPCKSRTFSRVSLGGLIDLSSGPQKQAL